VGQGCQEGRMTSYEAHFVCSKPTRSGSFARQLTTPKHADELKFWAADGVGAVA